MQIPVGGLLVENRKARTRRDAPDEEASRAHCALLALEPKVSMCTCSAHTDQFYARKCSLS